MASASSRLPSFVSTSTSTSRLLQHTYPSRTQRVCSATLHTATPPSPSCNSTSPLHTTAPGQVECECQRRRVDDRRRQWAADGVGERADSGQCQRLGCCSCGGGDTRTCSRRSGTESSCGVSSYVGRRGVDERVEVAQVGELAVRERLQVSWLACIDAELNSRTASLTSPHHPSNSSRAQASSPLSRTPSSHSSNSTCSLSAASHDSIARTTAISCHTGHTSHDNTSPASPSSTPTTPPVTHTSVAWAPFVCSVMVLTWAAVWVWWRKRLRLAVEWCTSWWSMRGVAAQSSRFVM